MVKNVKKKLTTSDILWEVYNLCLNCEALQICDSACEERKNLIQSLSQSENMWSVVNTECPDVKTCTDCDANCYPVNESYIGEVKYALILFTTGLFLGFFLGRFV